MDFLNLDCREDLLREQADGIVNFDRAWQDADKPALADECLKLAREYLAALQAAQR